MSEWKPIESAPKGVMDRILVATTDGEVYEASWQRDWYGDKRRPGWMIANCDEEYGRYLDATHWMPLPEPPKP